MTDDLAKQMTQLWEAGDDWRDGGYDPYFRDRRYRGGSYDRYNQNPYYRPYQQPYRQPFPSGGE